MNPILTTVLAVLAAYGIIFALMIPNALINAIPILSVVFEVLSCYVNIFILWNLSISLPWKIIMTILVLCSICGDMYSRSFMISIFFGINCIFPTAVSLYLADVQSRFYSLIPNFILTQINRLYNWASIIDQGYHPVIIGFVMVLIVLIAGMGIADTISDLE